MDNNTLTAHLQAAATLQAPAASAPGAVLAESVKTSGPSSVTATVCSTWADGWPSRVTTVQPSESVFVRFPPDAMADVVAHDPVAVSLGERLHGPADVAQILARPALADGPLQAL